ncbi:hypothetical protein [Tenuibacillus multivorans]|uniref:DUF3899 domain-containing protein n=1 Tax=Tenuibacillus multivorans TaxID=237069 RepID=A0A1G9X6Y9_9BACI|nr:hypothetical protein [Tenuibacillus multivorans]GEL78661.1 hypothetical protein TMU01_28960 [Tenuibacillus multivorans]SDM92492.1 hypothetical protein SAMN05216498_1041 [Tenuibacillus multivorans]
MGIIFLAISILSVLVLYISGYTLLFWVALVNLILHLIIGLTIPNIIAMNTMKKHKERVYNLEKIGATDTQVYKVIDEDVEIADEDRNSVPNWIYIFGMLSTSISVILLIIGLSRLKL